MPSLFSQTFLRENAITLACDILPFLPRQDFYSFSAVNRACRNLCRQGRLPLPWPVNVRLVVHGHTSLCCPVWSPDGRLIACTGGGNRIYFFGQKKGFLQRTKGVNSGAAIDSLAFSPNGALLVSATEWKDGHVKVWDVSPTNKKRYSLVRGWDIKEHFHYDLMHRRVLLAVSPCNQLVAVSASNGSRILLFRINDGSLVHRLLDRGDGTGVSTPLFSRDGDFIIFASHGTRAISTWQPEAEMVISTDVFHDGSKVNHLALSSDGSQLVSAHGQTTGTNQHFRLWTVNNEEHCIGDVVKTIPVPHANVWCVSFTPDDKCIVVGGRREPSGGSLLSVCRLSSDGMRNSNSTTTEIRSTTGYAYSTITCRRSSPHHEDGCYLLLVDETHHDQQQGIFFRIYTRAPNESDDDQD